MSRYPTFEEYDKRKDYANGIKRCDELLARNPRDVQLLITKLRLQGASSSGQDITSTLEALTALQPPIQDTQLLVAIEEAVVESQRNLYPRPTTSGPAVSTLYTNAQKSITSASQKLELQRVRFTTAIYDDRLIDAQQALIQLKVLQPKNRILYMAHAAVTQLLSSSNEDLQARLALSLARKAVKEDFDREEGLDCRVVGQILALQGMEQEVEGLKGKFADSKQVFDVMKTRRKDGDAEGNGAAGQEAAPSAESAVEKLPQGVERMKQEFRKLVEDHAETDALLTFAVEAIRLFQSAAKIIGIGKKGRITVDACFLSISALIRAFQISPKSVYLLLAAFAAETLLQHDPHVHEARMILVYLYMRLGLGSKAIQFFDSLKVREIQHDTVGHTLLTQISYTHPHRVPISRRENFEPIVRATNALGVYPRCEDKLAETESGVFNHGQTAMIFDTHGLRRRLRSSLTRRLILLEQRRLARLLQAKAGEEPTGLGPRVVQTWTEYSDSRDFNATFDFGLNVEMVLYGHVASTAGVMMDWLRYSLVVDTVWCLAMDFEPLIKDVETLATAEFAGSPDCTEIKDTEMSDSADSADTTSSSSCSPRMQPPYRLVAPLAYQILILLIAVKRPGLLPDISISDTISHISSALSNLNLDPLTATSIGLCDDIKDFNTHLDILRLTALACDSVSSSDPATLTKLREKAKSDSAALQHSARERGKAMSAEKVKAALKSEGKEVWKALDAAGGNRGDKFVEDVVTAARSGWEGLGFIQIV